MKNRSKNMFSTRNIVKKLKRLFKVDTIYLDEPDHVAFCSNCHANTLHKFIKKKKGYIILECYDCGTKRTWLTVKY
jgi:RNase P subunit RPR2